MPSLQLYIHVISHYRYLENIVRRGPDGVPLVPGLEVEAEDVVCQALSFVRAVPCRVEAGDGGGRVQA